MPNEIIVAILALVGTSVGSISGILASNRLTNFRIQQLEKEVQKLSDSVDNNLIERVITVEKDVKNIYYELDELKGVKR